MNIFRWVAAAVFWLQLPNPLFWLVVHPQIRYWRGRLRAAYVSALVIAWGLVTVFLLRFHGAIFRQAAPGDFEAGVGLLLIAADIWLFGRARRDLGTARLIGKTELSGGGEVVDTGIYAHMRNPRYAGMMASVVGACVLAATPLLWEICGVWLLLVLIVIGFEEHELRGRLGAPYIAYCRRVPRFIPYRAPVRDK